MGPLELAVICLVLLAFLLPPKTKTILDFDELALIRHLPAPESLTIVNFVTMSL